MADYSELKKITRRRLKTVNLLMNGKDWEMAVYIMGYTLECGLKAATCKRLRLIKYPDDRKSTKDYFVTHNFDKLSIVAGMDDLFSIRGPSDTFYNWSEFTKEYQGEWTVMRYDSSVWTEQKVRTLYTHLTDPSHGVLTEIKKRW